MTHRWRHLLCAASPLVLFVFATACATTGGGRPAAPPEPEPAGPPVTLDAPPDLVVEVIVTLKNGVPAENIRARDFEVTVDGRHRPGVALARLYRGPGAGSLASNRTATAPGEVLPLAEPTRTILLVVDQGSFAPGDERRARSIAGTCLGMLALSDRVAVVTLPARAGTTTIDFDRAAIRGTLSRLRALSGGVADALDADPVDARAGIDDAVRRPGGEAGAVRTDERTGREEDPKPAGAPALAAARSADAQKAHAVETLGGLERILRALRMVPGGKTVLLLSSGLVATDAAGEARAAVEEAARAQARIVVLQVPSTSASAAAGTRDLHLLAQDTGGRVVPLTGKPEQAIGQLAGQLAFSYLLLLAPMAGDTDAMPHALQVTMRRRPDLVVHAARRVAPGRVSRAELVSALSPRAQVTLHASPAVREDPAGKPAMPAPRFEHDHSVDLVLARAAQYVSDYGRALSMVVSEETYKQEVNGATDSSLFINGQLTRVEGNGTRTLVSDYLLVKVPGIQGWLPFRDVFEVDGQAVRDRQDRLTRLFLESQSPEATIARANEVFRESARYNIGNIHRTLNVPTLPLWFLEEDSASRFVFRKVGEDTIAGTRVWVIEYDEVGRPTFIKTPGGGDIPATGRLWVEPLNGKVHRTVLKASVATITVAYGPRDEIPGLLLPLKMEERYVAGNLVIYGSAAYSKFRQFVVSTTEQIVLPKK